MSKILGFIKKRPFYFLGGAILVILLITVIFKNGQNKGLEITVREGTIIQEVEATGKTKPAESVDLSFEKSGLVKSINVKIGNQVVAGQTLITLSNGELRAQLLEAEANLDAEGATLEEYKKSTRPEEIAIQETKVQNARVALESTKRNLIENIKNAYTEADNAIHNETDQLFSNPKTNPRLSYEAANSSLKTEIEFSRLKIETSLTVLESEVNKLTSQSDLNSQAEKTKDALETIRILLDKINLTLNNPSNLSSATAQSYKDIVSGARTSILDALSSLSASLEKFKNAESDLKLSENELLLDQAGRTPEEILSQEARVKEALAKIQNIQSQIEKTILRAPIGGTISKQETKVGEIISTNSNIVSIISENDLEIEANIPEINIGNMALSNPVSIEFDALPNEKFTGKVIQIEPGETIVNGVVNFKIVVAIDLLDPRVKSGFTSGLTIETGKKENVLILPRYAVFKKNGKYFVNQPISNNKIEETEITLGISGRDGNVEIVSGLSLGDIVLEEKK